MFRLAHSSSFSLLRCVSDADKRDDDETQVLLSINVYQDPGVVGVTKKRIYEWNNTGRGEGG